MINGVTQLFMMKADILNIFEEIKVCTSYKLPSGELINTFPYDLVDNPLEPVYESLKGWNTSLEGITEYDQFPTELKQYVEYLEDKLQVPINIVSTGPDRSETIFRK